MNLVILQARMGSSRLPGKILKKIDGKTLLEYQLERIQQSKYIDKVIVATTIGEKDDLIVEFCKERAIECFRGQEDDVLDRYYQCAAQYNPDFIIRLTGDCPLIDPVIIDLVICSYIISGYDYVSNRTPEEGVKLPDGMDVEIFSFKALENTWKNAHLPSEREHVTFYMWKNPGIFKSFRVDIPFEMPDLRLTVDYAEDFELISMIIKNLYHNQKEFGIQDILKLIKEKPELKNLNSHIVPNQGWIPSLEKDKKIKEEI